MYTIEVNPLVHTLVSIENATKAFQKLGEAAAKVEFPDFAEIKRFRLQKLKKEYGAYRFILPEYYRWLIGI